MLNPDKNSVILQGITLILDEPHCANQCGERAKVQRCEGGVDIDKLQKT